MTTVTNYGIIGCGMMGQEHLRNIALLPGTRVAAIFEPDAEADEEERLQRGRRVRPHRPVEHARAPALRRPQPHSHSLAALTASTGVCTRVAAASSSAIVIAP